MHTNELPLRKYFTLKDGGTTGPKQFSGIIGKVLVNKAELGDRELVEFKSIESEDLPELNVKELSKDQGYLYAMVISIKKGKIEDQLFRAALPTVHHARFINLASSILRFYVTEPSPSDELIDLVSFVMKVIFTLVNEIHFQMSSTLFTFGIIHSIIFSTFSIIY